MPSVFRRHALVVLTIACSLLGARGLSAQERPPAARAERQFTILIFEGDAQIRGRTGPRQDAYWTAYDDFAAALVRGGVLRGGSALSEDSAATVRGNGSADAAVRGARLGGYFVIAATDLVDARRWARLAPPQAMMVEVRPHRDNPHMMTAAPR